MKNLLILILVFCSCGNYEQEINEDQNSILELNRELFWKENIIPFIQKDEKRMLAITENPLGGDWGVLMEFKKHRDSWTKEEFIENYDRFFDAKVLKVLKEMNPSEIEIDYDKVIIPIGVQSSKNDYEEGYAMFLRFRKNQNIWKLYAVTFAG